MNRKEYKKREQDISTILEVKEAKTGESHTAPEQSTLLLARTVPFTVAVLNVQVMHLKYSRNMGLQSQSLKKSDRSNGAKVLSDLDDEEEPVKSSNNKLYQEIYNAMDGSSVMEDAVEMMYKKRIKELERVVREDSNIQKLIKEGIERSFKKLEKEEGKM